MEKKILGLDIGGSGIKGAIVDVEKGKLVSERIQLQTPLPATPNSVAITVNELVCQLNWQGIIGCSFPMVVVNGKCMTAGNMTEDWVGVQIDKTFEAICPKSKFFVANDADLAGTAEMRIGAGRKLKGKVIMITIGTGLGTGLFYNGILVPNIEMGRVFHTDGKPIEFYASGLARKRGNLDLKEWAKRFDFFLSHLDRVMSPNHFVIGGGLSKKFHMFKDDLNTNVPLHLAQYGNDAGIIGAALYAANQRAQK
ncbi:polyphosphate--glucose phosphotransferase [Flagellimonas sp.]|uniref:polyphosphate--glucose phosphotransferase n=1 Tax=Flagellimonas sp. TaxID=2058762 RepID=UPI003BA98B24